MNEAEVNENVSFLAELEAKFSGQLIKTDVQSDFECEIRLAAKDLKAVVTSLRNDFSFNLFLSVTAIDFLDHNFLVRPVEGRFDLVYHFLNLNSKRRLRVKVAIGEENPTIDSLCDLYESANFMEREVWDMYGITFKDHPDLRRILMYEEFEGFPLRKDYPVQGKQPRIELRSPEVENTARLMKRDDLVQINTAKR